MSRRGLIVAGTILIVFLSLSMSGCNKYTRHKVLTFFFTGVPHPDEEVVDIQVAQTNEERIKLFEKKLRKRGKQRLEIKIFTHGPYGANQCYQCHNTAATAALYGKSKKKSVMPTWSGGMPGRLVAPLKKLCTECHTTKSAESAYDKDLWIHGPVSDGMCTLCHNPHQSKYEYMLVKETTSELCRSCHGKGYIIETEDHLSGKECTSCHNAHLGKNRFMLKKDFNEIF